MYELATIVHGGESLATVPQGRLPTKAKARTKDGNLAGNLNDWHRDGGNTKGDLKNINWVLVESGGRPIMWGLGAVFCRLVLARGSLFEALW